jgi:hypothetical protein
VFLVTITGAFLGYSDRLSPTVHRALLKIVDIIDCLRAEHVPAKGGQLPNPPSG